MKAEKYPILTKEEFQAPKEVQQRLQPETKVTDEKSPRIKELEFAVEKLTDIKNPDGVTKEALLKLREPTKPKEIEWRVQASGNKNGSVWARIIPYIDARAVMDRLDKAVG